MKRWLFAVCGMLLLTQFLSFQASAAESGSTAESGSSNSDVIMVASGGAHTLALKRDGTVWAWGINVSGQLGYGSTADGVDPPVRVQGLDSVVAVTAGWEHSMALRSDGTVWTWGSNSSGQLGTGSTLWRNSSPAQVANLNSVVAIASGQDHNLAVKSDGTVWAWGDNRFGALGDGSTEARNTPVQVQGLDSVTRVSVGSTHSLALKSDGTVWTWGSNGGGELGDGSNIDRKTPVQVKGLSSVISIAAGKSFGFSHSLALKSDGTVWAWGGNATGSLGDGTTTGSPLPVQVIHLDSVTAIAAGRDHSLALKSDGTVWAWGDNNFGQLGNGGSANSSSPVQVTPLGAVSAIAADGASSAVRSDGTVWGWGYNGSGQLGDGTTTNRHTPVQVQETWLAVPQEPQWPQAALTVTDVTYNSVRLNWQPAADQTGVDKYLVYNTVVNLLATLNGDETSYEVKGLSPDTYYTLSVIAVDADGNKSEENVVHVSTAAYPDTGSFQLTDSKTSSDGWYNYEYSLYEGYISSSGQVLSGSWAPPKGYHALVRVSIGSPDGENYDLSLKSVGEGTQYPETTDISSDGIEYSTTGLPEGYTAEWNVRGHTIDDYSPDKKVIVYVSIKYDNH